jgi:hypothetical protein
MLSKNNGLNKEEKIRERGKEESNKRNNNKD